MSAQFKNSLPNDLVRHVTEMCGARGEAWFDALPGALRELEGHWNIRVGRPFAGIEYNFVAEAVANDGAPVVIKIAPPYETPEIYGEAKYLRLRDGVGSVRLLAEDRDRQAILLERAVPGEALHERFSADPVQCIEPSIAALKRVLQPAPEDLSDVPTLDEWFEKFHAYKETAFPRDLAAKAIEIYQRLSSQPVSSFYIHGDYHPGNIVTASREAFLVIDPKGIVGRVGYDIAVFLINLERWQRGRPGVEALIEQAISKFAAAFDLTELDVREWVFVHMVIGAWWNFEDMPALYDPELAMPAIWHL